MSASVPTPHIQAAYGEIAPVVLMPGDPLRAKKLAETYLENPVCYNTLRGMLGYTGMYKGKRVSVQGSGMGIPSIGIYSHELYNFYGVESIIRIGTAGAIDTGLRLGDLVLGMGACTNSNYVSMFNLGGSYAPIADWGLLSSAAAAAERLNVPYKVGNIISSDTLYGESPEFIKGFADMGVLAVEMEAAGLYMNAARAKKRALALLTISDCLYSGEKTTPEQRQNSFTDMMEVALELI